MFRSLAIDVAARRLPQSTTIVRHRSSRRPLSSPHSHSLTRFLSTPIAPSPTSTKSIPPPPPPSPASRKPKVDLRPAPIKPQVSTSSTTYISTKPNVRLPRPINVVPTEPTATLGSVKETAKRDIEDAEAHGILKPPPPDASWVKRTLHKAIELAKFYYRGVKLIFVRRKEINLIRARIKQGGPPLSRAENRLIRTQKDDINKVIPFLFIALLLEEIIPLIAIYAPFMLPSTCILPSQRARIEEKRSEKATTFAITHRTLFLSLRSRDQKDGGLTMDALREPGVATAFCGLLRLSTVGIDSLRIRRIRNHLDFLAIDDQLLIQDNIFHRLSEKSIEEALEERGIIISGLSSKAKEARLKWWLGSVSEISASPDARRLQLILSKL
ncbi:hypothetical protein BDZ94DRAFT_1275167 [Collybia nuda]|uniref:Letm1 RBD domain-containing protein n=1 Tax=Collybia nuda TaxID=64659 RepID=A0A9P5XU51_9AGAR|nr:hypothetical protein BDZ94DRAFT_1275167 [Collybia nuda]